MYPCYVCANEGFTGRETTFEECNSQSEKKKTPESTQTGKHSYKYAGMYT